MTIHFFDLGISIADSEPQPLDAYVQSEMRAQLRIRTRKRTCRRLAHNPPMRSLRDYRRPYVVGRPGLSAGKLTKTGDACPLRTAGQMVRSHRSEQKRVGDSTSSDHSTCRAR